MPSLKEILAGLPLMEPATNTGIATNSATNAEIVATNKIVVETRCEVSAVKPEVGKSANRRDREAYNAYQREYMRKRRAR